MLPNPMLSKHSVFNKRMNECVEVERWQLCHVCLKSFLRDSNMPTMPPNIDILLLQISNIAKLKKKKENTT